MVHRASATDRSRGISLKRHWTFACVSSDDPLAEVLNSMSKSAEFATKGRSMVGFAAREKGSERALWERNKKAREEQRQLPTHTASSRAGRLEGPAPPRPSSLRAVDRTETQPLHPPQPLAYASLQGWPAPSCCPDRGPAASRIQCTVSVLAPVHCCLPVHCQSTCCHDSTMCVPLLAAVSCSHARALGP